MRILLVGGGGREHALAWKLAQSASLERLYCAPANPGIEAVAESVPIAVGEIESLAAFASENRIDLTVVGPEAPLVAGIADVFAERGLRVFGPGSAAAEIEGSKVFCRELAHRHGVPMAQGETFQDAESAEAYAGGLQPPLVVKADGLAAGKGVLICETPQAATEAVDAIMRRGVFGEAGSRVVVEEFLQGRETSLFALTDGESIVVLEAAQDYKRALDGDEGLNTGGMGAYSPVPGLDAAARERAVREIVEPLVAGMREEGRRYVGCLYAGLMLTADGPKLLEVNARFGDPEVQALVRRWDTDLLEALDACVSGGVSEKLVRWSPEASVCVVVASGGYPGDYASGVEIFGVEEAEALEGVVVFHAGTAGTSEQLVSAGGRVLNVTATGADVARARGRAYEAVQAIHMEGMHYRTDIAKGV